MARRYVHRRRCAGPDDPAVGGSSREALALTWAAGHTRSRMGTDTIQLSRRLAVKQRDERVERVGSRLTRIWSGLYTRPRMGTDAIQPSRQLAVTRLPDYPTTRLPDYPTTRLPDYPTTRLPDYPTTRLPDYPTTRLPDYPTTRLPRAARRSADRVADHAAADRSAPVLSAAPLIRVAPARHACVLGTADDVGRNRHHATPTRVTTLAVSYKQMSHMYDRHDAWRRASKEARV